MSMDRDALMREVDEELRREQMQKVWEQYGTYIVAGAFAVLIGVGGFKWWESRKIAAAERAGQQFEQALDLVSAGKADEARSQLQAIGATSSSSYAILASLALAGQSAKAGKTDEAVAAYDAAAARAGDPLIKDYARLQSVALKVDSADFTDVKNRLNDLIADTSPWRYMARELLGVAALRSGKLDEARTTLAPLSADMRAPAAVRDRAGALMNLVVAAEQEREQPGKVELEPTDPPAAAAKEEAPKVQPPTPAAAPPKGTPKGK